MNIQWSLNEVEWNECVDSMMELLLDFDKISENGRNIYEWNQINQSILEIDFDRTSWNGRSYRLSGSLTFRRFGISNTINIQYSEVLSNVTKRGYWKLNPLDIMDVRFGRSTFNHFESFHYYFALSTNLMNDYTFQ